MSSEHLRQAITGRRKLFTRDRITFLVVGIFAFTALSWYGLPKLILQAGPSSEAGGTIFAGFLGVVTSLIASLVFYFLMDRRRENAAISYLKQLAPAAYLDQLFDELAHYRGDYREDVRVDIELIPSTQDGKILCKVRREYKQYIRRKHFTFVFNRKGDHLSQLNEIPDDAIEHDFIMGFDEGGFPAESKPVDEDYRVNYLIVDGEEVYARTEDDKHGTHSDLVRRWRIPLPRQNRKSMTHVHYEVEFPVEVESFYDYTHDFPTHGFTLGFSAERLNDLLEVHITHSSGLIAEPNKITAISKNGKSYFVSTKWHAPTELFCFMWWKRK